MVKIEKGGLDMFGIVTANIKELTAQQRQRYNAVYCGICRQIRTGASQAARLGLSYDTAFLALLLMSLYEPEETGGDSACILHPIRKRGWVDNEYIRYAADMNVALAYYKALDDVRDEGSPGAKVLGSVFARSLPRIQAQYPRQWAAIRDSVDTLSALEAEGCADIDRVAGCFGSLMGQLMLYRQDLWQEDLYALGHALGRFIYLTDAAVDYRRDRKKGRYNPFLAMGMEEDWQAWEQYLVLAMARCTHYFEKLPLVQDKDLLDSILYSGVWMEFRARSPRRGTTQEETT